MADKGEREQSAPDASELINARESETDVSKCPSCGANLKYNPVKKCLECEHCGTSLKVELGAFAQEVDFSRLLDGSRNTWGNETRVFRCNNCGAKEILAKTEISKKCAFCGTTNVAQTEELSGLKPNAVLPFLIGKDDAASRIKLWLKKRKMAPGKFKKTAEPEDINGNYTPAFTFDTQTVSTYKGRLGKHYYVTTTVNGHTVTEQHTDWFIVSGKWNMAFDDILIQAGSTIDQQTINKLSPFGTNNSQKYSGDFLHGFSASQYSKDGRQCWEEAKAIIQSNVRKAILKQYTHDVVDYLNINMTCNNITYKYVLLPVYVGHCNFSNKLYNYYVNGQNGKVTGKTPISGLKVLFIALGALAAIALIGVVAYFNLYH